MNNVQVKNQRGWHFVPLQKDIIEDESIKPNELAVFVVLNYYANWNDGTCYPSYETIAKKAGVSKVTAIKAAKALEAAGYLKITRRKTPLGDNDTNLFTVLNYRGIGEVSDGQKKSVSGGKGDIPGVVKELYPGGKGDIPGVVKELYPEQEVISNENLFNENLFNEILREQSPAKKPEHEVLEAFNEIFQGVYRRGLRVTKERLKQVQCRLKTYTANELIEAARNLRASKFHCGENDRNWVATPEFLYRNDTQVDKFLAGVEVNRGHRPNEYYNASMEQWIEG